MQNAIVEIIVLSLILQEEWKRKIEGEGGAVHAKIKKGIFFMVFITSLVDTI